MPLTKTDLQNVLKQQETRIQSFIKNEFKQYHIQLTKFLEKHVLKPIFDLKDDVSGLKKDVSVIKKDVSKLKKDMSYVMHEISNINRKIDASFNRANRHSEKLEDHEKRITKLEATSSATF